MNTGWMGFGEPVKLNVRALQYRKRLEQARVLLEVMRVRAEARKADSMSDALDDAKNIYKACGIEWLNEDDE